MNRSLKNSEESFEIFDQIPSPSLEEHSIQNHFRFLMQCIRCNALLPHFSNEDLWNHIADCSGNAMTHPHLNAQKGHNDFILIVQEVKVIVDQKLTKKELNALKQPSSHETQKLEIESELNTILNSGKISKGSIKQYKRPLQLFYDWLWSIGKRTPTAYEINQYIQNRSLSFNALSALGRLIKVKKIILTEEQKQQWKMAKGEEADNVTSRPFKSWNIDVLQQFINDLCDYKMFNLAFRIFILFELGSRVSELQQITFGMILDGEVNYIPQKQQKRGEEARRSLVMPLYVIQRTRSYMNITNISEEQTLNIGEIKEQITYNAMQKQLQSALQLIQQKKQNQPKQYNEFLHEFSYHDLRHSKLKYLSEMGNSLSEIQSFVNHEDHKTTKKYLKGVAKQKMTLDGKIVESKLNSQKLEINFWTQEGEIK